MKNTQILVKRATFAVGLTIISILCLFSGLASASIASGFCGGVDWVISDEGVLSIAGNDSLLNPGEIPDFERNSERPPWTGYAASIKSLDLKDNITYIGNCAFYSPSYSSLFTGEINLPENLTHIGDWAFYGQTGLTGELILPEKLEYIGFYAFGGCRGLTGELNIPNSVMYIGDSAFHSCRGFTYLKLPSKIETIDGRAFCYCDNISNVIEIPESVTKIGQCAFYSCSNVHEIIIKSSNVTAIDGEAFYNLPENSIICVNSSRTADLLKNSYSAISSENTSILVLNGGNLISYSVASSSLPTSQNITKGDWTLAGWYENPFFSGNPTTIRIPGHFYYAKWVGGTTGITASGTDGGINWVIADRILNISENQNSLSPGIMPDYSEDRKAPWDYYITTLHEVDLILLDTGIITIGNYAFYNLNTNTTLFSGITEGVTTIGNYAFYNASGIASNTSTIMDGVLIIPKSVSSIGTYAFSKISGVTTIDIQNPDISNIGENAFTDLNESVYSGLSPIIYVKNMNVLEHLSGNFNSDAVAVGITNGGNIAAYPKSDYSEINLLPTSSQVVLSGFDFSGWFDNSDFAGELKTNYNAGHTYYLRWVIEGGSAANGTAGGIDWEIIGDTLTISANMTNNFASGYMPDYTLTNNPPWYQYRSIIKHLNINEGIIRVGAYAFFGCSEICGTVSLPASMSSFGNCAFTTGSNITAFTVASNLYYKVISDLLYSTDGKTLYLCPPGKTGDISILDLPNDLERINTGAFFGCSKLSGVFTIGPNVTSIGGYAFSDCTGITTFTVNQNNQNFTAIDGVLYNKDVTSLIAFPAGKTTKVHNIALPSSLTKIEDGALYGCSNLWWSIILPNCLTHIGDSAFYGCSGLWTINIQSPNITSIGENAFIGLASSSTLYVDDSDVANLLKCKYSIDKTAVAITNGGVVSSSFNGLSTLPTKKYIDKPGFVFKGWYTEPEYSNVATQSYPGNYYYAKWTKDGEPVYGSGTSGGIDWNFSENILTISPANTPETGFSSGQMKDYRYGGAPWYSDKDEIYTLIIDSRVTSIGNYAFTSLTHLSGSLILPDNLTSIGAGAFEECIGFSGGLEIPNNVTYVGDLAFMDTRFTEISLSNNLTNLNDGLFLWCTDTLSVNIPDGVKRIGNSTFGACSKLESITLPESLTSIGQDAFWAAGIKSINISQHVCSIGAMAFDRCNKLTSINVDMNNPYYSSLNGVLYNKDKTRLIVCPGGKISIFSDLDIPNSVIIFDDYAFDWCTNITGKVIIPNGVTKLGVCLFSRSGITEVTIPESIDTIRPWAFEGCSNLQRVIINSTNITSFSSVFDLPSTAIIYVRDSNTAANINSGSWNKKQTVANTNGGIINSYPEYPNLPTDVAKEGWTFEGWFEKSYGKITTVYSPAKTYAIKWIKIVSVSDTAASSNDVSDFTTPIKKIDVPENSGVKNITLDTAANVADPSKEGYNITVIGSLFNISITDGELNDGKELTFKFNLTAQEMANQTTDSIRLAHLKANNEWEYLNATYHGYIDPNYMFTVNVSNFSPFGVVSYVAEGENPTNSGENVQSYSSSPSGQTGYSVILPESTDSTDFQTQDSVAPTIIQTPSTTANPTTQPTQQSPAPFLGILAGLGVAALVLARLRR